MNPYGRMLTLGHIAIPISPVGEPGASAEGWQEMQFQSQYGLDGTGAEGGVRGLMNQGRMASRWGRGAAVNQ